jgi:hypothetical protein
MTAGADLVLAEGSFGEYTLRLSTGLGQADTESRERAGEELRKIRT